MPLSKPVVGEHFVKPLAFGLRSMTRSCPGGLVGGSVVVVGCRAGEH
jgi:hypothetical protein